jgi:hypothetical protein
LIRLLTLEHWMAYGFFQWLFPVPVRQSTVLPPEKSSSAFVA